MFEDQLTHVPIDPPRRPGILPGLRFSAAVPQSALFLPFLFVGFLVLIPLTIMNSDPAMKLAMRPTHTAQGRVLSMADASACRSSSAHRVVYTFSPQPGRELRGATTLCQDSPYYALKEGDAVEVQFVVSDPAVNTLRGTRNNTPSVVPLFLAPVFFLAIFSSLFMPQVREVLRARRGFKNGRLASGTVIYVKKRAAMSWPGWFGNSAAEVFVEFQPSIGEKREAVAWCQNDWVVNQMAPGATVHIAYTDDPRERVTLLEGFLR
jgi:hypothetical protein